VRFSDPCRAVLSGFSGAYGDAGSPMPGEERGGSIGVVVYSALGFGVCLGSAGDLGGHRLPPRLETSFDCNLRRERCSPSRYQAEQ